MQAKSTWPIDLLAQGLQGGWACLCTHLFESGGVEATVFAQTEKQL